MIFPVMLVLCLMLSKNCYAKNDAGIIGLGLAIVIVAVYWHTAGYCVD